MNTAGVSVVIPVYNGERFLGQAIESVLRQELSAQEVIVVDDGSSDTSAAVAEAFGGNVRCLRQTNRGIGAARNAGVSASTGPLLAFLDADDIWQPAKLRLQVERLTAESELDCVFGLVDHFHEPGEATGREVRVQSGAPGLHAGTMLIQRESFLRAGYFPESREMGEFIAWYGLAQDAGVRMEVIPHVVLRRRIHANNTSARSATLGADYLQVIRANLQRRRGAER